MKTPRKFGPRLITVLSLTTAGALVGGTWWYGQSADEFDTQATQASVMAERGHRDSASSATAAAGSTSAAARADVSTLDLRLDGSNRLVDHDKPGNIAARKRPAGTQGVEATSAGEFVENDDQPNPLDLEVPASLHDDAEESADDKTVATATAQPNPLDVSKFRERAPKVESYNLFKSEYGLRGFMKQNWINQRVALQGGLGLNDDRLIKTDSDFRDDIAFGMGLIVAF